MDINSTCLLLIIFTWTGNFVHAETTEDTQRVFVGNREISGKQMIWIYCEWSIVILLMARLIDWLLLLGCCDRLIITSKGDTLDYNSAVLGTYIVDGVSNGWSLYKNMENHGNGENLYLHYNDAEYIWLVCTWYCTWLSPLLTRK